MLRSHRSVGIQWNTQVTLQGCAHLVSQVYCSALPVAYASHPPELWESFARLVLEAAYEATLCAAVVSYGRSKECVQRRHCTRPTHLVECGCHV